MVQNLKDQIKFKGLQSFGGPVTPLRDVEGDLVDWVPRQDGERVTIDINLENIEVHKTEQPYEFPNATIGIRYSDNDRSGWGYFTKSFESYIPEGGNMDVLRTKRIRIRYQNILPDGSKVLYWNGVRGAGSGDEQRDAFVVVAVDGINLGPGGAQAVAAPTVDLSQLAIDAAVGKSRPDAMQAMMAVNELRTAGAEVMNDLMSGKFINDLIADQKLIEVEGVLQSPEA